MTGRRARLFSAAWLIAWPAAAILTLAAAHGASAHHLARALAGVSLSHPLGCDAFGRDLLAVTLRASVTSCAFALVAVAISVAVAIVAGTAIAASPRTLRFTLLRGLETLLAFPTLLFALAWAAIRGPGWDTLVVALLLGTLPPLTRLVYARARELYAQDFVEAARGLGASPARITLRHLAPGVLSLCRVKIPNLFAHALLAEATLSFLGIGAPIGHDTWGSLLAQGKDYLLEAPHLAIGSGLPLVLTVLSLQILSETHAFGNPRR